jgi:predicted transcriptional regulator
LTVVGRACRSAPVHKDPDIEPLGDLETAVMEVVWANAPRTAREVWQEFRRKKRRAYTTIMTTLDRLFRKGLLSREKDGLAWRYAPLLSRSEAHRLMAATLARRIVGAHGETALAAFVDAAATEPLLLDRLATLVARRRKGGRA